MPQAFYPTPDDCDFTPPLMTVTFAGAYEKSSIHASVESLISNNSSLEDQRPENDRGQGNPLIE